MQTAFNEGNYPARRKVAIGLGVRFYFTGKPCRHGHTNLRYTSTGQCAECHIPGIPGNPIGRRMRAAYVLKHCVVCGKEMQYEQRNRECCSHKCSNTLFWHSKNGKTCKKVCPECRKAFEGYPSEKYCSVNCKKIVQHRQQSTPEQHFKKLIRLRLPGRAARVYNSVLTYDDLMALYQKQDGKCALSGEKLTFNLGRGIVPSNCSIDRIDSAGEYTLDNVQLVCHAVNIMKHNFLERDFVQWCKRVTEKASQL